jgi:predicted transcriptional regulator
MPNEAQSTAALLSIAGDIIASFVANNTVSTKDLPLIIGDVHAALHRCAQPAPEAPSLVPAVNPKKSVTPDYIICLEDGKRFKSMRRHLANSFGMTPEAYRAKWDLPFDYPMVAPNYSAVRSEMAVRSGLGKPKKPVEAGRRPTQKRAARSFRPRSS